MLKTLRADEPSGEPVQRVQLLANRAKVARVEYLLECILRVTPPHG